MPAVIFEFFKTIHSYFLWRNVKGLSSHINLLVNIHTGDDEEDPGPPGSSSQQSAKSEDDGSLVLLGEARCKVLLGNYVSLISV